MEYVEVQGARVPALGLGTWQMRGRQCVAAVSEALDIGYRHIDTAQMYDNEEDVGEAIAASGVDPSDLFVTTKLSSQVITPADVRSTTEESLKKLRLDRVDLLLVHQPVAARQLDVCLAEMRQLQDEGRVGWIGLSNFTVAALEEARAIVPLQAIQIEHHPLRPEHPQVDAAQRHDLLFQAYSPIDRGRVLAEPAVGEVARRVGATPAQVVLRWLLDQPNVAPIPKASSRKHLLDNWGVFEVRLGEEDRQALDRLV